MKKLLILGFLVSIVACGSQEDPRKQQKQQLRDMSSQGSNGLSGDDLDCYVETLFEDASSEQIDAIIAGPANTAGKTMVEKLLIVGPGLSAMGKCGISPSL